MRKATKGRERKTARHDNQFSYKVESVKGGWANAVSLRGLKQSMRTKKETTKA